MPTAMHEATRGRITNLFGLLILAQAAHSVEETIFHLYDVLAPARFISSLVSSDIARGFVLVNLALVAFGAWCYFMRVRPWRSAAIVWASGWAMLEAGNGTGHLLFALMRGGYFPGAWTAPFLLGLAAALGHALRQEDEPSVTPLR